MVRRNAAWRRGREEKSYEEISRKNIAARSPAEEQKTTSAFVAARPERRGALRSERRRSPPRAGIRQRSMQAADFIRAPPPRHMPTEKMIYRRRWNMHGAPARETPCSGFTSSARSHPRPACSARQPAASTPDAVSCRAAWQQARQPRNRCQHAQVAQRRHAHETR